MIIDFFKRQSVAFYVLAGSAVFMIIGLIIYSANANGAYFSDRQASVIWCTIGAIALCIALMTALQFVGDKSYLAALYLIIVGLLSLAIVLTLISRAVSMGYVLFTSLDRNPISVHAMTVYFIAIGFYVLAIAACIAAAFMKPVKGERPAAARY